MNTKTNDLKEVIKSWIINIDKTEELPSDIVALSFNLYEPYGLEMVGSIWFDERMKIGHVMKVLNQLKEVVLILKFQTN